MNAACVADALHHLEAEDALVEGERAVEVRHLEVDVPDVDAGIDHHPYDDSRPEKIGALRKPHTQHGLRRLLQGARRAHIRQC